MATIIGLALVAAVRPDAPPLRRALIVARGGASDARAATSCVPLGGLSRRLRSLREEGEMQPSGSKSGTSAVEMFVYRDVRRGVRDESGGEWAAVGVNRSMAAVWLRYELRRCNEEDSDAAGSAANESEALAVIAAQLCAEQLMIGDRSTHRRIERLWRSRRLLLHGHRLADLAPSGRMHASSLVVADPARGARLAARNFRRELMAYLRRVRHLRRPRGEVRQQLLDFVRQAVDVDLLTPLQCPTAAQQQQAIDGARLLDSWRDLLEWFRERFPYNRCECASCGAIGEFLGNVYPLDAERSGAASRCELQACGACGRVQRFARYNGVPAILAQQQGRCGEYSQLLYQLVRALGWRARLVVDWSDHMWVEAWLPLPPQPPAGGGKGQDREAVVTKTGSLSSGSRTSDDAAAAPAFRWVHMDPCEASIDEPRLYAGWNKEIAYVIAIGDDGRIEDVTRKYARDWDETLRARDLCPRQLRRALGWARLVTRTWVWM
jgi:hypothetical protein